MKILLLEDDKNTADFIVRGLKEHGHVLDVAHDGHDALMLAQDGTYDGYIFDRMVPKLDGLSLLKVLRASENHTPALILSALADLDSRLEGLQGGGDDYLVKPFAFSELHARINLLARRGAPVNSTENARHIGDIHIDLIKRIVTRDDTMIPLQATEFRLLDFLARHAGQVVTRTMLLEGVWDFHFDPKTNIVETHISRLRSKIDKGFTPERIKTIRGAGYMLDDTL